MDNVKQIVGRMKRIVRIVQTMEPGLRDRILVLQLEPGEELFVPEFPCSIVLVQSGLLKDLSYISYGYKKWKCFFFWGEGDCFDHRDKPLKPYGTGDHRYIAVEPTTVYCFERDYEMLKEKLPVLFRHISKAGLDSLARFQKLVFGTKRDPLSYLQTFHELFPGIHTRADEADLATCLFIEVKELNRWLKKWQMIEARRKHGGLSRFSIKL